ncbi:uncharacterized protein LOC132586452 [Heteronotia binoei]|uniref:uncharacterized protein LOC132586452 n=1 Tax=Heteronotia binoei TaxID=13085 RepID=UPI002931B304|nr:uncharacterized protein LOC132586452 [Heteronotia binoei]
MEASFTLTVPSDCCFAFGATLPPARQMLPALSLFFIMASLAILRPAAVVKQSHDTCEEIQAFQGVQDTRAFPGKLFFYPISSFAFHGTITHYKVSLANGSVLPKWLEYNPTTRTLQGLPMLEESGEYYLTVAAHGEACDLNTPVATVSFTLHVHNHITVCEKQTSTNQKPTNDNICSEELCARDTSVTFAEIIIYHTAGSLTIQERISLIYAMAEYLHLDPSFLTLIPFKESFNKYLWNLTVLREDTKYISTVENHYVGLCWPVGFGVFAMLYELEQVLRHNVQSNHLSKLLGYEIAGWRILQKVSNEKKQVRKQHRRQLMVTPRPTVRPTKIAVKPTKIEAFTFWSIGLLHTKFAARPNGSSSSLYHETVVPSFTDISFHSVTSQRDLGTLHVLSVHTRPPAFTILQSLSSAVPELSPSMMTLLPTEFGRQDDLPFRTQPLSELPQFQQQGMHSTPQKSEPKPHFTQYYLSSSVPASKTQASRSVQSTISVSVSQEDALYGNMPVAHFPKEFVTNLAPSSPNACLTTAGLASDDTFLIANLPVLSTRCTLAKLRFPVSNVATSLFFSGCSHQNQDLFSDSSYVSESFMSSPQVKEHLFTEENSPQLPSVLTEMSKWAMDLNLMDVTSTPDLATTGSASVHELWLAPETSPVPQLYYSDETPALTTYSIQESIISLFTSPVEFGLQSRTSSIPTELPSLPLSTTKEMKSSFTFHDILPVEELWSISRCGSQKVFKTDEHASESFVTVPQTNELFLNYKASSLTKMHVETPLWKEPCNLIYITTSGGGVLSSQFLSVNSLCQGASQTYLCYPYDTPLLSLPIESVGSPTLQFSTNYFSSYASGVVRIPVACPGVLQLETSDLILASSLGTNAAFPITRQLTSWLLEDSIVTSLQAELHATSVFPGVQGSIKLSLVIAINRLTINLFNKEY